MCPNLLDTVLGVLDLSHYVTQHMDTNLNSPKEEKENLLGFVIGIKQQNQVV